MQDNDTTSSLIDHHGHLFYLDLADNRGDYTYQTGEWPCLLCQRPVKDGRGYNVGLDDTNSLIVPPEQSTNFHVIGSECYRKHKNLLKPYAIKREGWQ